MTSTERSSLSTPLFSSRNTGEPTGSFYLVTGGFGASANSRGSAVFCTNLYDGKPTRYERMDVMGEVKTECMPHWAVNKATVLKHIQGNKLIFEYGGKHFCPIACYKSGGHSGLHFKAHGKR